MSIKKLIINHWLLVIIILLASILRLYKLGEYPIHITNDEAALGYNAYSIAKTARDEHGVLLPVVFKSFGDWKPGLYVYLTVPFVAVFGLSEVTTRIPSALMGILAIFLIFKIAEKLFNKNVAILSAFSLAILPWHIHFSRGAWEGNVAVTLLLAGTWFFLRALDKEKYLLLSAAAFGLSLWTYQSMKLGALLYVLVLVAIYHKKLFKFSKKSLVSAAVIGLLITIPIGLSLFSGKGGRISVMSVFSYTRPEEYLAETVFNQEAITRDSPTYILFHSEKLNLFRGIAGRYFNYFSGRFLLFDGDWSSPRHSEVDSGYLLFIDALFLLVGIYGMLRTKINGEIGLVLLLLLVSPIPSVLTRDSVQGIRALPMIIPLSIILGYGFNEVVQLIKKSNIFVKIFSVALISVAAIYSLGLYLDAYYIQTPESEGKDYLYGYEQAISKIEQMDQGYQKIVFSQSYDQPYIFFLFYGVVNKDSRFEPQVFQKNASFVENLYGDVGLRENLDKIEFRQINWAADRSLVNTLLVGRKTDFPPEEIYNGEYKVQTIKYLNGDTAFILVEGK